MPDCSYCNKNKWFGGVKRDGRHFCDNNCSHYGALVEYANRLPGEMVDTYIADMQTSKCPKCSGPGPIEVHTSHQVWSALVVTSWSSQPRICCKKCATFAQLGGIGFSVVLGWWGIPWGIIATPVQIIRNIGGMFYKPTPGRPSPMFVKLLKVNLAQHVLSQQREEQG